MSICPKNESLYDISTEKSFGASVPRNVIEEDDGKGADGGKEDNEQQDFQTFPFGRYFYRVIYFGLTRMQ